MRQMMWRRCAASYGQAVGSSCSNSRSPIAGFARFTTSICASFFPGARDVLAAIDDELVREVLGTPEPGRAACFEDQYASTGGQLYELMAGHERFVADLRPLVTGILAERGLPRALCCHPYDICTALIAEQLGVIVTGPDGEPIDATMDLETDVAWAGYANEALRARVEPALHRVLARHGLR